MTPKVSKGSETPTPPVAEMGGVEEASEKEQHERQRSNATIEQAGPIGKPFGRVRNREIPKERILIHEQNHDRPHYHGRVRPEPQP